MTDAEKSPQDRPAPPRLEDIRAALASETWNDNLTPAFAPIAHPRITDRMGRGFYGEDILARTVTGRGEIILDYGSGIEDVNKGGPDLVTLAEDERGLYVKCYDNKAYSTRNKVSEVSSLGRNFDKNLEALRADWRRIAADAQRTDSERALFGAALDALDDEAGPRLERVVTGANGRVVGPGERLTSDGIIHENVDPLKDGPGPEGPDLEGPAYRPVR